MGCWCCGVMWANEEMARGMVQLVAVAGRMFQEVGGMRRVTAERQSGKRKHTGVGCVSGAAGNREMDAARHASAEHRASQGCGGRDHGGVWWGRKLCTVRPPPIPYQGGSPLLV